MRSSFFEYHVAVSGMFTAKSNLNVVSHNLANAAMPGYSRQYAMQRASTPMGLRDGRGMYGTGSEVFGVGQHRDTFIDKKYWRQNGMYGQYAVKTTQLSQMETIFSELSDTGIRSSFDTFFSRLQDLARETQDGTYRNNAVLAAEALADTIRTSAISLQKQQSDLNTEVDMLVTQVNSLGNQIASISRQIHAQELDGSVANDLRDQRALLVDQLSELVNVEVEELDYSTDNVPYDKRFIVTMNGYDFVNHYTVNQLKTVPREADEKRNEMDVDGLYDIYFGASNIKFNIYSDTLKGRLKGLIDVRDGNNADPTVVDSAGNAVTTTSYKGIPFYMNKLNTMVRTIAQAFNDGVDINGDPIDGVTGHRYGYDMYGNTGENLFFTYNGLNTTGGVADINTAKQVYNADGTPKMDANGDPVLVYDYGAMNCLNFIVNPKLIDPDLMAATSDPTKGESANDVIMGFLKINSCTSLFREGKLTDYIIGVSDHLAIDTMQAANFEMSYADMIVATDNQRLSVSGVDLNEEMMNMIRFEQMYQVCARMVNAIDEIYNTLINKLGVG